MKQKLNKEGGSVPEAEQNEGEQIAKEEFTEMKETTRGPEDVRRLVRRQLLLDIPLTNRAFLLGVATLTVSIIRKDALPDTSTVLEFTNKLERMLDVRIND